MIGTYFDGRLGNQFFRYAFARMLRYERGEKDDFVFNFNCVIQHGISDGFEDELKYFNVLPYRITTKNLIFKIGSLKQKIIYFLERYVKFYNKKNLSDLHYLDKKGLIYSREDTNNMQIDTPNTKTVITCGKFESSIYLKKIRPILLQEFTPKKPVMAENSELFNIIQSSNSVCVTIRRGDYLNSNFKSDFFVCDLSYFEKAIDLIHEKIENAVFVFFSDDISWVKNNIKVNAPCYYESGKDPIWEKIRLMYSCKHFIISNSTFSWWAQYLSRNENKIVVSPDRWFANPAWRLTLIEDSFIKIQTEINHES